MGKDYGIYLVNWHLLHTRGLTVLQNHPEDQDVDNAAIGLEPFEHQFNLVSTEREFLECLDDTLKYLSPDQPERGKKVFGTLLSYGNHYGGEPIKETTAAAHDLLYQNYFGFLRVALAPDTTQHLNEIARGIDLSEWEKACSPMPFTWYWDVREFRLFAEEWLNALNTAAQSARGIMVFS